MFEPGAQIAYIPTHVPAGDLNHPDVEFGFVVTSTEIISRCRFWRKGHLGDLRTKANGENAYNTDLKHVDSVSPEIVKTAVLEFVPELKWLYEG